MQRAEVVATCNGYDLKWFREGAREWQKSNRLRNTMGSVRCHHPPVADRTHGTNWAPGFIALKPTRSLHSPQLGCPGAAAVSEGCLDSFLDMIKDAQCYHEWKSPCPSQSSSAKVFLGRDAGVLSAGCSPTAPTETSRISMSLCSRGEAVCVPEPSTTDVESHFLNDRHKIKQLFQHALCKPASGNVLVILNVCYVLF